MEKWIIGVVSIIAVIGVVFIVASQREEEPLFKDGAFDASQYSTNGDAAIPQGQQADIDEPISEIDIDEATKMEKPELTIDNSKTYKVTLHTTAGDIVVELDAVNTPITANNFVYLAEKNYYDNTIFHRVIDGFMIQGGDPTGTGTGDPGYKFDDEPITGEYTRGTLAMANSGPNTNGSQFFIMHQDYPLPKDYVIFGKVIEGIEVVDKIATAEVKASRMGEKSSPVNPVTITDTSVIIE